MNNAIIAAAASLAIGVGVGWSIKPATPESGDRTNGKTASPGPKPGPSAPAAPATAGTPAPEPAKSGRTPEGADTPWNAPAPGEGGGALGGIVFQEPDPEAMKKQMERRHAQMKRRHDLLITDFARRLDLTPEQQDKLRDTYFAGVIEQDRFWSTRRDKPAEPPTTPSLGEALGEILTDEQATAYDTLRKSNMRAAARSEALEELAELSYLDLTREQSERLFNAMMEEAEEEIANEAPAGAGATLGAAGAALLGAVIGNNVADEGGEGGALIGASVGAAVGFGSPTGDEDPEAAAQRNREATEKIIAQQVAEMQDYLTPEQLEEYRHQLELGYSDGPHIFHGPDYYLPQLER